MNYQPSAEDFTTSEALPKCPCCSQTWKAAPRIEVSLDTNTLLVNGKTHPLTPQEAEVFTVLLKAAPGTARTRALHSGLWGLSDVPDSYAHLVKVRIHHLRKRLVGTGFKIKTVWGSGYQLIDTEGRA
jgi:DNA-binding response OmpR family regulator